MPSLATEAMAPKMTVQTRMSEPPGIDVEADTLTIPTRFGEYEVLRDRIITFPKGLIGFGAYQAFALLNLPEGKGEHLKLLQSIDEPSLSFYVLPVPAGASGHEVVELEDAASKLQIRPQDLAVLLIVTVRQGAGGVELTANLRAPVLIDTAHRIGHQHVMANDKYPLRQKLN